MSISAQALRDVEEALASSPISARFLKDLIPILRFHRVYFGAGVDPEVAEERLVLAERLVDKGQRVAILTELDAALQEPGELSGTSKAIALGIRARLKMRPGRENEETLSILDEAQRWIDMGDPDASLVLLRHQRLRIKCLPTDKSLKPLAEMVDELWGTEEPALMREALPVFLHYAEALRFAAPMEAKEIYQHSLSLLDCLANTPFFDASLGNEELETLRQLALLLDRLGETDEAWKLSTRAVNRAEELADDHRPTWLTALLLALQTKAHVSASLNPDELTLLQEATENLDARIRERSDLRWANDVISGWLKVAYLTEDPEQQIFAAQNALSLTELAEDFVGSGVVLQARRYLVSGLACAGRFEEALPIATENIFWQRQIATTSQTIADDLSLAWQLLERADRFVDHRIPPETLSDYLEAERRAAANADGLQHSDDPTNPVFQNFLEEARRLRLQATLGLTYSFSQLGLLEPAREHLTKARHLLDELAHWDEHAERLRAQTQALADDSDFWDRIPTQRESLRQSITPDNNTIQIGCAGSFMLTYPKMDAITAEPHLLLLHTPVGSFRNIECFCEDCLEWPFLQNMPRLTPDTLPFLLQAFGLPPQVAIQFPHDFSLPYEDGSPSNCSAFLDWYTSELEAHGFEVALSSYHPDFGN